MYFGLLKDRPTRSRLISVLKKQGVQALSHYVPLHSSPAGKTVGRVSGSMQVTDDVADRLLRLPMYRGIAPNIGKITQAVADFVLSDRPR
jgi:dTDP-4-amino-4,6-dideoxygalactose transaminase